MKYDAIIVGGGMAGLTASAFLSQGGHSTLLIEKEDEPGGLVGSFDYNGFVFDKGIRATENSGILFPMLRQLGIELEFVGNKVSLGIGEDIVDADKTHGLEDYTRMLMDKYPGNKGDITELLNKIQLIMKYMDILYGIDNPMFMDLGKDYEYIIKTLFPWMFRYMFTVGKIRKFNKPVDEYLEDITDNRELNDIIVQHFFKKTPAFFALSYFRLYYDYKYPKGGTGSLVSAMVDKIRESGGSIITGTRINSINPDKKTIYDSYGNEYRYGHLVWAADMKAFYDSISSDDIADKKLRKRILEKKEFISDKTGGDSVLTLYLATDIDKSYFEKKHGAHFFYTPLKDGISSIDNSLIFSEKGYATDKDSIKKWLSDFFRLNTFEISIPCLRDPGLAPEGKTGLIVSVLMDHAMAAHIRDSGWYDEFKEYCRYCMIDVLDQSIYRGIKDKVTDGFVSTPLTIEERSGNSDGAITGWAFTNESLPAVSSMPRIAQSVKTPFRDISQAGQWTYSPAGLPISILTGKMAANRAVKALK